MDKSSQDADAPPHQTEASIGAVLDRSRRDIAAGRTVPLQPVLDHMQKLVERIRRSRATAETDHTAQ